MCEFVGGACPQGWHHNFAGQALEHLTINVTFVYVAFSNALKKNTLNCLNTKIGKHFEECLLLNMFTISVAAIFRQFNDS